MGFSIPSYVVQKNVSAFGVGTPMAASVGLNPDSVELAVGSRVGMGVVVRDGAGGVLVGKRVVWGTSDTVVAAVDTLGLVRARGLGQAVISAESEGARGEAAGVATMGVVGGGESEPRACVFPARPEDAAECERESGGW